MEVIDILDILTADNNEIDKARKVITFEGHPPFTSFLSKINKRFMGNTKDLDIVTPIYSLLECRENYSMTLGRFQKYYRDKIDDVYDDASDGISFKYKTKQQEKHQHSLQYQL